MNEARELIVVCERASAGAESVRAYLARCGVGDARWVRPRDVDDISRMASEPRVVFSDMAAAMDALFDGRVGPQVWRAWTIEFADSSAGDVRVFGGVFARWSQAEAGRRRRAVVAGWLLSIAAIAAGLVIAWM